MIAALVGALISGSALGGSPEDDFVEWASKNAVPIKTVEPGKPFDDLRPIRSIVGDARVVCLGESRHDAHEHFRFKHRMIEFLVREMGFTLFAMEESLPCAGPINEYILGGDGDPEVLVNSMGGWFIWDTEEVLAMVKWMREYNEDANCQQKVRFYGFDITNPLPGIKDILAYLDQVDPEFAKLFRTDPDILTLFDESLWSVTLENYRRLAAEGFSALTIRFDGLPARLRDRQAEYLARSSRTDYDWLLREAVVAKQANDLFTTGVRGTFTEAGDVRERAMADNIRWILGRAGKGERLIIWAHNFHVSRSAADLEVPNRPPGKNMVSMVAYLSEELGDDLVSFGFSFNRGDFPDGPLPAAGPDTLDGVLARVGLPRFVVDLRAAPKEWVGRKMRMRGEGGHAELAPGDAFDAIFFVDRITKTVPTRAARRRFESLGR